MLFVDQWNWSVPHLSAISDAAGLCRLNQASLGCDRQLSRGNTVGHETQFGIIRKAALCGDENYVAKRPERQCFRTVLDFVGHIIKGVERNPTPGGSVTSFFNNIWITNLWLALPLRIE